jgi:thioredoxin 1
MIRDFCVDPNIKATMKNVIELNETNFALEVLGAQNPVLVHFWAGWSEKCKVMTPLLESVAEGAARLVKVARLNVEQHEELVVEYGVRCVPTVLIFNNGGVEDQIIGHVSAQEVHGKLERFR